MDEQKIIQLLLNNQEQLQVLTGTVMGMREQIADLQNSVERLAGMVKQISDDHVFAVEWLKRIQSQLERQDEDIRKIKMQLKLA